MGFVDSLNPMQSNLNHASRDEIEILTVMFSGELLCAATVATVSLPLQCPIDMLGSVGAVV